MLFNSFILASLILHICLGLLLCVVIPTAVYFSESYFCLLGLSGADGILNCLRWCYLRESKAVAWPGH